MEFYDVAPPSLCFPDEAAAVILPVSLRTRWLFSVVTFMIVLEAPAMSNLIRTDFAAISCFCAETLLIFLNL